VFEGELTERRQSTQIKAFHALFAFGGNVEEYMHLIIPIIVKACERSDASTPLRIAAVQTIDGLSRKVNFSDHASRVIHPLVRVLSNLNADLRAAVMDTLCVLLVQLGADFAIFVPMINKVSLFCDTRLCFHTYSFLGHHAIAHHSHQIRQSCYEASQW
jgi:FKBP12-rapamycin complex-associated protein